MPGEKPGQHGGHVEVTKLAGSSSCSGKSTLSETTPLIHPVITTASTHTEHEPISDAAADGVTNINIPPSPKAAVNDDGHTLASQALSRVRGISVFVALGTLIFIDATNMSLLTTTQSAIADELGSFEATSWFTSAFLISMSALGPLNGKLSSVFSPRSCIAVSAMLLALGSLICAVSNSFGTFVTGRCVQGAGASGVFTISIIVVLELTGSKRRGLGIGLLNTGFTVGVAVGATASGALLPITGWRALFWLQIPICLASGFVLLLALPADFHAGKASEGGATWKRLRNLDYLGAVLLTCSLVLVLYAMAAPRQIPIWPIVVSAFVLVLFVNNEVYLAQDPIIPISLLRSKGLLLTCLGSLGFMAGRWTVLFYAPTYALAVRTWSLSSAGAMLVPTNFGFGLGGVSVGLLHIKRHGSFYAPTLVSYLLFPVTLVLLGFLSTGSVPAWAFVLILFLCGCATGAAMNYNLAHLLHITPKETHYVATALLATFRGFAGSFGSALGGGVFQRQLSSSLKSRFHDAGLKNPRLVRQLLGSPVLVGKLEGMEREIAIGAYQDALKVLWLTMAVIALSSFFVQAGTGWKGDAKKRVSHDERQALLDGSNARNVEDRS